MKTSLAPGLEGGHRVPGRGRADAVPREARLPHRRLRLHHLHRQHGPAAAAGLRRHRGRATWSSPRCSRATATSRAASTPRCAPTTWCRRRWWSPTRWRAASTSTSTTSRWATGTRRQAGLPERHLADAARGRRDDEPSAIEPEMFAEAVRRRLRGRRALAKLERADGRHLRLGRRRRPTSSTRPTSRACRRDAGRGRRHPRRARAGGARRQRHHRPHLARRRASRRTARPAST